MQVGHHQAGITTFAQKQARGQGESPDTREASSSIPLSAESDLVDNLFKQKVEEKEYLFLRTQLWSRKNWLLKWEKKKSKNMTMNSEYGCGPGEGP